MQNIDFEKRDMGSILVRCVSKVCDDAMCEVDDDRFLFEQTCKRLGKEICSTYVTNHLYIHIIRPL